MAAHKECLEKAADMDGEYLSLSSDMVFFFDALN